MLDKIYNSMLPSKSPALIENHNAMLASMQIRQIIDEIKDKPRSEVNKIMKKYAGPYGQYSFKKVTESDGSSVRELWTRGDEGNRGFIITFKKDAGNKDRDIVTEAVIYTSR